MHEQNQRAQRLVRSLSRTAIIRANHLSRWQKAKLPFKPLKVRLMVVATISLVILSEFTPIFNVFATQKAYAFEDPQQLLPKSSQQLAQKLDFDPKEQAFNFNTDYSPQNESKMGSGGPKIIATAYKDAAKGVKVTDPVNNLEFTLTPKFSVKPGEQKDNRIVYPLQNGSGWLVYTMEAGQVKEDILLRHATSNKLALEYQLDLGDSLEAKLEKNGDIGVYGGSLALGTNVATGSDKDAELLQKARKSAKKDKLMFTIPAPVIKEHDKTKSDIDAHYELKDNNLTLKVKGLKKGNYPLTIDPSVYVTSASQFMYGNNDSNIDFNTNSDLIQKGSLTGARIPGWTSTTSLNSARSASMAVVTGGYVYYAGGIRSDGSNANEVYWAKLNDTTGAVESPNPGNGACTGFCTNTAYNLPNARVLSSLVTYNGYLYLIGGNGADCTGTLQYCTSVYKSRIGANGEPSTWTTTTSIPVAKGNMGAVAYNNRIYIALGQTGANSVSTVNSAAINPDGSLSTWDTLTAYPAALSGATMLQYNGYMYIMGGINVSTNNMTNAVRYVKINADGTLASSWVSTNSFTTARATAGGTFAAIYNGYMYIQGGCTNGSGVNCTTVTNDLQLASINADGSITNWATQSGITKDGSSHAFVAWKGVLYSIGGCGTGCSSRLATIQYGKINNDGDISVKISSPGTSACRVSTTTDCDLPAAGPNSNTNNGGRMASGVVINNGYIYNIGGCIRNDCGAAGSVVGMSNKTSYAAIAANGTIVAPATCPSGFTSNIWCVNTGTLNGTTGLGAMGVTVFNNTIYAYGGSTGSAFVTSLYNVGLNANGSITGNWTETPAVTNNGLPTTNARASSFVFTRANASPGTFAGNLYIAGGCTNASTTQAGIGCNGYVGEVYKCNILPAGGIYTGGTAASRCTTTGQLQIDGDPTTAGSQGLGISAGAIYGNFIYMAGGASGTGTALAQQKYVFYAEINGSNNIIDPTNGHTTWPYTTTDTAGTGTTSAGMTTPRRRATAYATNGYLYVVAGHDGTSGTPGDTLQDIQVGKIDQATGNIRSFSALKDNSGSVDILTARWNLAAAGANGYLYMIGGCTGGNAASTPPANCRGTTNSAADAAGMNGMIEYVQIYNNYSGSPVSYTAQSTVTNPADRFGASAIANNGYVYLAGGCTSTTDCATYTNNVSYVKINADGTITDANWVTSGTLPATRAFGCMVTVGNTLYYIGGQNGTGASSAYSTVYYSQLDTSTGAPGTWNTATNALPAVRSGASCASYNGRIYVVGGTDTTPTYQTTVYYSPDLTAGGNITSAWASTTAFTGVRSGAMAIAYGNNLYVMGGFDGTNYLSDVQYALIGSTGTVGTWNNGTSLPQPVRQGDGFAANGYMYIFGGRSAATTCTTNTYIAPINANPIVNKVVQTNPSAIGSWSQTSVSYGGARYGVAAAYSDGRAYLLGGICNGTLTGANRVVYGTLQSQPQISKYSIMIDTDSDVFPTKFLFNGIDSGIGARWLFNYQSSQSATNAWGQNTNFGILTLGTPGTYTAKNASGTNTLSARYYYLSTTIDASQSFGFPEDPSRGPTIDDITLQLSADPKKRLRNGKTFTGGQQQPLDTPF